MGQPFDTIKVRLQTNASYRGPIDCLRQMLRTEGFRTLFSGMGPPLMTSVAVNAVIFSSYGYTIRSLTDEEDEPSPQHMMIAGMFAGFAQSFICCPCELLKIRLQVDHKYKGTMDVFKNTVRKQGLKGLYRGFASTLYREVPAFGAYFTTYYTMLDALGDETFGEILPSFLAGGMAGAVSWTLIYPIDIAKSIIQMNDKSSTSFVKVLRDLHRKEGLKVMYRGLGTTIVRSLPVNAVVFPVYELSVKALSAFADDVEQRM